MGGHAAAGADAAGAQTVAAELGFAVEVLVLPGRRAERRRLARVLAGRGWSAARVARALGCCERTVERWARG